MLLKRPSRGVAKCPGFPNRWANSNSFHEAAVDKTSAANANFRRPESFLIRTGTNSSRGVNSLSTVTLDPAMKSLRHERVRLTSCSGQGSSWVAGMHGSAQTHVTRGAYSFVTARPHNRCPYTAYYCVPNEKLRKQGAFLSDVKQLEHHRKNFYGNVTLQHILYVLSGVSFKSRGFRNIWTERERTCRSRTLRAYFRSAVLHCRASNQSLSVTVWVTGLPVSFLPGGSLYTLRNARRGSGFSVWSLHSTPENIPLGVKRSESETDTNLGVLPISFGVRACLRDIHQVRQETKPCHFKIWEKD
jgi:hypothetical protein